jgi:UDP-glucuronate decarboxylase
VLITGGAGFMGTNLTQKLLDEGHRVIVVDNLQTGRPENLNRTISNPNYLFIMHDVIQPLTVDEHIDWIINLACAASPPAYQKNPFHTIQTSVFGAFNLLELAKKHDAVILQASTSEVYGDPHEHPQCESYCGNVNPIGPRACYDEGKRLAETIFFEYHRNFGTQIKVIRIFNTYGPHMDPKDGRVVSNFIMQALRGEPITIYGDGSQTRSFCFVDDLVNGIIAMMESSKEITGPVNLGNPGEFTVKELAEIIIKATKSTSEIFYKELPKDDPTRRRPNIARAKEELHWEPTISLDEGLAKTIEYFKTEF